MKSNFHQDKNSFATIDSVDLGDIFSLKGNENYGTKNKRFS